MSGFPSVINISAIDGSNGLFLAADPMNFAGYSVSGAGDVNGDGIDDMIVSASGATTANGSFSGGIYVVFGTTTAPATLNLGALDGTNGFRINGAAAGDQMGRAISSGDINGDGLVDLVVGANYADNSGADSGSAYVIFGHGGPFAASVDLASLDGATGFRFDGAAAHDYTGRVLSVLGDVNGDGVEDFIVGAAWNDATGAQAGSAYVVFGRDVDTAGNFQSVLTAAQLDGTNGFRLHGGAANDMVGVAVSRAGDINGDGVEDMLVGALNANQAGTPNAGSTTVVFGKAGGGFASDMNLSTLSAADGFRIVGQRISDQAGAEVSAAGDINGDGIDDLLIGAPGFDLNPFGWEINQGAAYVVYGRNTAVQGGFGTSLSVASLDGTNGFQITGINGSDALGTAISAAGDLNADGIDDLVVTSGGFKANGVDNTGALFVLYGRDTATEGNFAASFSAGTITGAVGFRIEGGAFPLGIGYSVSGIGDFNNDGTVDLAFGANSAGQDGSGNYTFAGGAYILYGLPPPAPPVVQTAGPAGEVLTGDTGNDILTGNIGKDTLHGLAGDDALDGGDGNDLIHGGAGADVVRGGDGGDTIFGGDGVDDVDGGTGADKLYGDGGDDIIVGALGNDYMYGGADNDSLTGAGGNDMLDGGAGADAMAGGVGNDVYIVDDAGDTATELLGEGTDIVRNFLTFVLGDNVEAMQMQGTGDIDGTGNALTNNMQGNAGANTLWGLAGVDTLNGGDGGDTVVGGLNNDLLRGGLGADTFVVLQESVNTAVLETDIVYDFSTAEGDRLDLSAIDANILVGGEQGFVLVSSFTHAGGQMTATFSGGQTTIRLDVDGDNAADYQIRINGDVTGDTAGWLL